MAWRKIMSYEDEVILQMIDEYCLSPKGAEMKRTLDLIEKYFIALITEVTKNNE